MIKGARTERSREHDKKDERKVRFASEGDELLDIVEHTEVDIISMYQFELTKCIPMSVGYFAEGASAKKQKKEREAKKVDREATKEKRDRRSPPKSAAKKSNETKKGKTEPKPVKQAASKKGAAARERKWDDFKDQDPSSLKTGLFSAEELLKLQQSIVDYAIENDLKDEELNELLSKTCGDKYKKAWVEIAQVLPDRKVQSCMAVCRRKFNPNNYKGRWSQEEEDFLLEYVGQKGRHWEEIAKELGRTALNVRDKYKELGEENHKHNNRAKWTVEETVKLFRAIQKLTGVALCKPGLKELSDAEVDTSYTPKRISKNNPTYQPDAALQLVSKHIDFEAAKTLAEHTIPWTSVASKVKSKSKDACRNRWYTQVYNTIHEEDEFTKSETQKLIDGIRNQDVDYEQEIDFGEIQNGHTVQENKHQWEKLKKLVTSRCLTSVSQVLLDLVEYMRENKSYGTKYKLASAEQSTPEPQKLDPNNINQKSLWAMFHKKQKSLK